MADSETVYPTFLLIGVAKGGTTWIHQILDEHPDVYVPPAKDLKFFDEHYDLGLGWYLDHFKGEGEYAARGELTHDYYFSAETARRIYNDIPDVKIFICLRELGDKMLSGFRYNKTTEYDKDMTFSEYAALPGIQHQNRYYDNLVPFYELFGKERMMVVFFDTLQEDPAEFCREIYEFVGVDADYEPPSLLEKINVAHEARMQWVAHLAFKVAHYLRKWGLANLVGKVKHNPLVHSILYRNSDEDLGVSEDDVHAVCRQFSDQYDKLADLIGKPLPASWYDRVK